jgi:hypothetical protein
MSGREFDYVDVRKTLVGLMPREDSRYRVTLRGAIDDTLKFLKDTVFFPEESTFVPISEITRGSGLHPDGIFVVYTHSKPKALEPNLEIGLYSYGVPLADIKTQLESVVAEACNK